MARLALKHQLFADYFLGEAQGNAMKAATMAGFKQADKYAHRLLQRPDIAEYVEKYRTKLEKKYDISKDRIAQELAALAFERLGDLINVKSDGTADFDFRHLNAGQRAAMSEFSSEVYMDGRGEDAQRVKKNKVKFHSKQAALEALSRLMGYTNDTKNSMSDEAIVALLNAGRARAKE